VGLKFELRCFYMLALSLFCLATAIQKLKCWNKELLHARDVMAAILFAAMAKRKKKVG
jgi:hypothetical protein